MARSSTRIRKRYSVRRHNFELRISHMSQKVIYSEPTGGLCNRMGALNYAYLFAKEYNCRLVILWKDNLRLHAIMRIYLSHLRMIM